MYYYRHPIDPYKFQKAYEMRHNPTPAEERMWEIIKSEVMPNFPDHVFRRQYVAYGYILDFYCPTLRLGLEIDGEVHDGTYQRGYDKERDSNLARHGIRVLRARNESVFSNPYMGTELCRIIDDILTPWYKKIFRFSSPKPQIRPETVAWFCPNCRNTVLSNYSFCPVCGQNLRILQKYVLRGREK
jgi:very-short-patch-repair endonuclease